MSNRWKAPTDWRADQWLPDCSYNKVGDRHTPLHLEQCFSTCGLRPTFGSRSCFDWVAQSPFSFLCNKLKGKFPACVTTLCIYAVCTQHAAKEDVAKILFHNWQHLFVENKHCGNVFIICSANRRPGSTPLNELNNEKKNTLPQLPQLCPFLFCQIW